MRFFRLLSHIFVTLILSFAIFLALKHFRPSRQGVLSPASPLPDFLTMSKNGEVTLLNLWLPLVPKTLGSGFAVPEVTAESVLMYDLTSAKTIYEKDSRHRLPMASLTKIMTAIVSIEHKRPDDRYLVKQEDIVGEDSMGLTQGERLSFEELLYGLMMQSGNDAAEVLAEQSPLGRDGFIRAMNDKAASLGLTDTHFDNPSGLQGDGVQYTTAYDLLVMTRYAMETFPLIARVVSTASYTIPQTSTHKEYDLNNETNLLTTYPGVKGVKTGYTPEAGLCLVTYLDYGGHKIIGIILNSQNRRGEMKDLLDYSLNTLGTEPPPYSGG